MHKYKGAIVAHIGPMFGGKTSGLLADVRKMSIAKYNVALFKPAKDDRYSHSKIVNHDGQAINSISVNSFKEIIEHVESDKSINVVAIDEFQFINATDENITVDVFVKWILNNKKSLIVSGLDLDSDLNPFDKTKDLLPYATHIFKHKAVCVDCGNDATTSYCTINKDTQELVGGSNIYIPLCMNCYIKRKEGQ